jgi:hypothetical protein
MGGGDVADANNAINQAEVHGGVILPSLVAAGIGIYKLSMYSVKSSSSIVLVALGLFSIISVFLSAKWSIFAWCPIVLGWYAFGILGCMGIGLAISENSGLSVSAICVFWLIYGWYTLSRARKFRRFVCVPR